MPLSPATTFADAAQKGASDVHIVVGHPVLFRIDGILRNNDDAIVTTSAAEKFIRAILSEEQWKRFEADREIDVSYGIQDSIRLRVNCHFERGNVGLVARIIPEKIPSFADVRLEGIAEGFCSLHSGLILITGPTGSGKSTSMASMIQHINTSRAASIVTLEDPIEFLFPKGKSIIRQRQYGDDFSSFPEALKRVLRQDPNIVMVGEMRDLETIAAALTLAETGHLIFASLHTPNTSQTIDRIVDVFPPHQQGQIRTQLSLSLTAIIAQRLLPKAGGGRIVSREILINTPAVANIIREDRVQELPSVLQTGSEHGMRTFAKDMEMLLQEKLITKETMDAAR